MDLRSLDQSNKNIKLGLDRLASVLENLWNPHHEFSVIHIAGTNGKGSVTKFLELLYLKFKPEMRIGKFTSPHLVSVTERISVNGIDISEDKFKQLYKLVLDNDNAASLTEFEKITCVAFLYFKEQGVELAILETGLGGRLDATNICDYKLATAITNISLDHMEYLGDTIEKIRIEKEGIKRDSVPHFEGEEIRSSGHPNSSSGQNFLLALKIFETVNDTNLTEEEKKEIIAEFEKQSRARFALDLEKRVLVDGAHNPAAAKELASFISEKLAKEPKTFIIAMMDKDFEKFLEALSVCINPETDRFIFTKIDSARSLDPKEMLERAKLVIANAHQTCNTLAEALEKAQGFKVITGSLYLAGEYYSLV